MALISEPSKHADSPRQKNSGLMPNRSREPKSFPVWASNIRNAHMPLSLLRQDTPHS